MPFIRSRQACLLHLFEHVLADQRGRLRHHDSRLFQSLYLADSVSLALLDYSSSVTHPALCWGSQSSNEANNWLVLLVIFLQPVSSQLLGLSSDLANHHNSLSFGVDHEFLQNIDEVSSVEGVASNANNSRLSEACLGGLVDCLIGESSRSTDDSNFSSFVDVARHDTDLALVGLDDSGTVWPDDSSFALRTQGVLHLYHVVLRNT